MKLKTSEILGNGHRRAVEVARKQVKKVSAQTYALHLVKKKNYF